MKNKVVEGQPSTKNGKPYKNFVYSNAVALADNQSHIKSIQNTIKAKMSQWVRPMLPSLQWRVRAGLAPDFPSTFRGCVVCLITIRQKTGMSNGPHSPTAFRTVRSSTDGRRSPFGRGTLRYNMFGVHAEHAPEKPKGGENDRDKRVFSSHLMKICSILRPKTPESHSGQGGTTLQAAVGL